MGAYWISIILQNMEGNANKSEINDAYNIISYTPAETWSSSCISMST